MSFFFFTRSSALHLSRLCLCVLELVIIELLQGLYKSRFGCEGFGSLGFVSLDLGLPSSVTSLFSFFFLLGIRIWVLLRQINWLVSENCFVITRWVAAFCSTVFFRSADVKDIRRWILLDFYPSSSSSSLQIASQLCDSCVVPVCGLCLESHTAVGLPSFVMRESCSQAGCGRGAG